MYTAVVLVCVDHAGKQHHKRPVCDKNGGPVAKAFGAQRQPAQVREPADLRFHQRHDRRGRLWFRPVAALDPGLATELGVSRTTVTAACDQLVAEGYLDTGKAPKRGSRRQSGNGESPSHAGSRSPRDHLACRSALRLRPPRRRLPAAAGHPRGWFRIFATAISRRTTSHPGLAACPQRHPAAPSSAADLWTTLAARADFARRTSGLSVARTRAALQGRRHHRGERLATGARPVHAAAGRSRRPRRSSKTPATRRRGRPLRPAALT